MALIAHEDLSRFEIRIIVAGSRSFNDYPLFCRILGRYLKLIKAKRGHFVIISGKASKGADAMAIEFAKEHDLDWAEFPADWDQFQKRAGFIRNAQMREHCTHLLAFWDFISPGTANMIDLCTNAEGVFPFVVAVRPDR